MTTTVHRRLVDHDPSELRIALTSDEGGTGTPVIAVTGEIDAATVPRLIACFQAVVAHRPSSITVDLTAVPFLDSSGISALVDLCSAARPWGGSVEVTGVAANVRRVFDITGIGATEGLVLR
jgi:anti-anti-sigma factor